MNSRQINYIYKWRELALLSTAFPGLLEAGVQPAWKLLLNREH